MDVGCESLNQGPPHLRRGRVHDLSGHEDLVGLHSHGLGAGIHVPLIAEVVPSRDVIDLSVRSGVEGHHAQCPGLVVHVADLAERGAPARHQYLAPPQQAYEHPLLPVQDSVVRPEDHREAGNRHGESALPERPHQKLLADELVAPVVGLAGSAVHGKILVHGQNVGGGVYHCGAGEDVVPSPPLENVNHALDVLQHVGADVEDHVELLRPQCLPELRHVLPVGVETAHVPGQPGLRDAPVEGGDRVPAPHQLVNEVQAVEPCASHDQHVHVLPPVSDPTAAVPALHPSGRCGPERTPRGRPDERLHSSLREGRSRGEAQALSSASPLTRLTWAG